MQLIKNSTVFFFLFFSIILLNSCTLFSGFRLPAEYNGQQADTTIFYPDYWSHFQFSNYQERTYPIEEETSLNVRMARCKKSYDCLAGFLVAKEKLAKHEEDFLQAQKKRFVLRSLKTEKSRLAYHGQGFAVIWLGDRIMVCQLSSPAQYSAEQWQQWTDYILEEYKNKAAARPFELSLLLREETEIKDLKYFYRAKQQSELKQFEDFFYLKWQSNFDDELQKEDTFFGFRHFSDSKEAEDFLYRLTHQGSTSDEASDEKFIFTQWYSAALTNEYRITFRKITTGSEYFFQHGLNVFVFYGNFNESDVKAQIEKILQAI